MRNLKKEIMQGIKIVTLALMLSVGVSYVFADWEAPTSIPPVCPTGEVGCDAPIHVGLPGQEKKGALTVGGFRSKLLARFDDKVGIGTATPNTNLTVQAGGANGINLLPSNGADTSVNSGRLFFSNASNIFSIFASNQFLEFSYDAIPGAQSGTRAFRISKSATPGKSLVSIPAGSIQIVDGTQGAGKVLTSDANGLASWATPTGVGGGIAQLTQGNGITFSPGSPITSTSVNPTISINSSQVCASLGGVFASNKCQLGNVSQNVCEFLGGTWNTLTSKCSFGTGTNPTQNAETICLLLKGTWNGTACSFGSVTGGVNQITSTNNSVTVTGVSTTNLAVNTNIIQSRVTGSCVVGQTISSINVDGTVACQPVPAGATGATGPAGPVGATGPQGTAGFCIFAETGVASTEAKEVSLLSGTRNICNDGAGCTYKVWRYTTAKPAGSSFFGSSEISFRQISDGNWHDAEGNETGINGNSTKTTIFNWGDGLAMYDDDSAVEVSVDKITIKDNSATGGFRVAICD